MSVALYMDAHIPRVITLGLRMRTVDVLTAQEDGAETLSDPELLDRAARLGRVVFTFDDDLLVEATKRQRAHQRLAGVIYAHPLQISIGQCIRDLELIAKAGEPEDLRDLVQYLPL
jgi:hypothetical protein